MSRLLKCILVVLFFLLFATGVQAQEGGQAYYDFGVFAFEDADYPGAEANFKKALTFSPDNPFYNHFLGKTYLKLERYPESLIYLEKAWELDSTLSGLKYDLAYLKYKMDNFSEAAVLFEELAKEDPANILAHYHAGISLYRQQKYRKALGYFMVASEKSPTIKTNGYYYAGACYQKIGDYEKAVEMFEYVRDHADKATLKENAIKWLEAMDKQKKAMKPYSVYMKLGVQYDDNVTLEPLDIDRAADENDWATVFYYSGKYNVINRQDVIFGAGFSQYQTWYDDLEEYDLTGSILDIYGKYNRYPFPFGFNYKPTYYWLDSNSYVMKHQLTPQVSWRVNQQFLARLSYSYFRNNYFQDNDRDGHTNEVFLDGFYTIGDKWMVLFGRVGYEDNTASHPDQYYERWKTRLGATVKLPWEFSLSLTGRYQNKRYDNEDSFFLVTRKDDKYSASISLSHNIVYEWLSAIAEYAYTKNDSNISDYEYERNVTTLSLSARF